jgi:hypothetical protein
MIKLQTITAVALVHCSKLFIFVKIYIIFFNIFNEFLYFFSKNVRYIVNQVLCKTIMSSFINDKIPK